MNNIKLKQTLEYCLNNLKHPETTTLQNYYYNGGIITDGYYAPLTPTSQSIIDKAEKDLELAHARAKKIQDFEECLENIKMFISELS